MNILVIAAHPDDEVLGCGATIARCANEGFEIYIAILGEGITSRYQQREKADYSSVEALHTCSRVVAKKLGARDVFFYNLPDNRFDTVPLLDIVKITEELIDRTEPEIIYTHYGGDLNIDHSILNRAVVTATRPVSVCPVREIYAFEVASSTEWTFGQLQPIFRPNVFMDIHDTLEVKIDAMALYESESHPFPHPRSLEALRASALRWGSMAGLEAAEAFELIRAIR
jgi:LmbE family N-acetylglucosaminyl deacetylase